MAFPLKLTDRILKVSDDRCDRGFAVFLAVITIVQICFLLSAPIQLSPDEAHYWLWSKNLDAAFYSKGPVVAQLIAASTFIFGDSAFGVRVAALICLTGFSILFYLFLRDTLNARVALLASIWMRTTLMFYVSGVVITTDPPVILFLIITATFFHLAVTQGGLNWIGTWSALGIAVLSKYTALILAPAVMLSLLAVKTKRSELFSVRFLLGVGVLVLLLFPVILWNAQHQFVNFAHNSGHLTKGAQSFTLRYFFELLGGQLGLFNPLLCVLCIWAIFRGVKRLNSPNVDGYTFLTIAASFLVVVCVIVSFKRSVYANWPFPAFVAGLMLLAREFSARFSADGAVRVKAIKLSDWILSLNLLFLIIVHVLVYGAGLGIPIKYLPIKQLIGWTELAKGVDGQLSQTGAASVNVITDKYQTASEIAFYSKHSPRVWVAVVGDRRMNQHDIWGGWKTLAGKDAVLVLSTPDVPVELGGHFASVEKLPVLEIKTELGERLREHHLFVGRGYDGYVPPWPEKR